MKVATVAVVAVLAGLVASVAGWLVWWAFDEMLKVASAPGFIRAAWASLMSVLVVSLTFLAAAASWHELSQ